jgi:RHS repeat-associated protein
VAYTAYGHHPAESGLSRLIGFNGECPDPTTGHYPLGQGTRTFNPVLMRFNSPDELSPFGKGGINAYAYCEGDPINFSDPTGNVRFRPWNFPTSHQSSKITGLDLSSNTGFSANGPVSSPIASIPSAKVPDEQSIFSLIPAEHEPIRSKTRVEKRAKQNDLSLTSIRKRRRLARKFDDLVRNEPSFRSSAKPLLNDYVTAAKSAEIEIKADPKKIHNVGMRLQHKRQITKRNILIELGHEAAVIRGRPPKN